MRRQHFQNDPFGFTPPVGARFFLGSLISGGLGLIGGLIGNEQERKAQSKANYANEMRYQQALGFHRDAEELGKRYTAKGEAAYSEGVGAVRQAGVQARNEVEKIGREGRRSILQREGQQLGASRQSLTSRGLGNTTVLDAAARGIAFDTNRALAALDEQIAGIRAGTIQSSASQLMSALGSQANYFLNSASLRAGLIQNKINTVTGRSDVANPNAGAGGRALGQLGGFLGGLYDNGAFNGLFGGGGGGGSGTFVPGISPFK